MLAIARSHGRYSKQAGCCTALFGSGAVLWLHLVQWCGLGATTCCRLALVGLGLGLPTRGLD